MLLTTPASVELFGGQLDQLRKKVVGYFRFHEKDQIELVVGYNEAQKVVHVLHLTENLNMMSFSIPSFRGVLVLFGDDENLYTLKAAKSRRLAAFYEKVRKPEQRPKGLGAYMVPGI